VVFTITPVGGIFSIKGEGGLTPIACQLDREVSAGGAYQAKEWSSLAFASL